MCHVRGLEFRGWGSGLGFGVLGLGKMTKMDFVWYEALHPNL